MNAAVVIPTCRPQSMAQFLRDWEEAISGVDLKIIEDSPTSELPGTCSWQDIERRFGDGAWIISRRDSAIRSFGYWLAWHEGAEFIVTIDDDCLPGVAGDWVEAHRRAMRIEKFRSTIDGVRVRGLPYNQVEELACSHVNVGLWHGVLDFDAITQLSSPPVEAKPLIGNTSLLPGQYAPMCGMNLAFSREAAPLMYFGLQGQGRPVGRFDDIWCGVLAKRISDHLGWVWTFGQPIVLHQRASDPFRNLVKEAPGVAEHEHYWRYLAETEFAATTAADCMLEAGERIRNYQPRFLPLAYFQQLGEATQLWAKLFL